jgi:hypothetical protein
VLVLAATAGLLIVGSLGRAAPAQANPVCDVAGGSLGSIAGGVGFGSPVGDICNAVSEAGGGITDAALSPLKDAAGAIGNDVFKQLTSLVADGATWLLGEVVALTDSTTTPHLLSRGFVDQYRRMALIATMLAAAALLFAVVEAVARGDMGMLWRALLVNLPVAAIATSAAYVVVQLLLGATDGLCHAVAAAGKDDTREFFKGAINGLAGFGSDVGSQVEKAQGVAGPHLGATSAAGGVAVPVFVGLIAAAVAAFAAFFVWIELLMRDAAVYVVALFLPLALAASISPRWSGALRRTAELLVVIVFSKFVIVAIIALAASVLANGEGGVEHVLSAGALLLLACFSPLVLMRWVPLAEGAVLSAYGRQSAAGGAVQGVHIASSATLMRRSLSGGGGKGGHSGVMTIPAREGKGSGSPSHGGGGAQRPTSAESGGGGGHSEKGPAPVAGAGGARGTSAAAAAPVAGVAAAAAKAPGAAAKGSHDIADRFGSTTAANPGGGETPPPSSAPTARNPPGRHSPGAAPTQPGGGAGHQSPIKESPKRPPSASPPEPSEAKGGEAARPGEGPQRPSGEEKPPPGRGGR